MIIHPLYTHCILTVYSLRLHRIRNRLCKRTTKNVSQIFVALEALAASFLTLCLGETVIGLLKHNRSHLAGFNVVLGTARSLKRRQRAQIVVLVSRISPRLGRRRGLRRRRHLHNQQRRRRRRCSRRRMLDALLTTLLATLSDDLRTREAVRTTANGGVATDKRRSVNLNSALAGAGSEEVRIKGSLRDFLGERRSGRGNHRCLRTLELTLENLDLVNQLLVLVLTRVQNLLARLREMLFVTENLCDLVLKRLDFVDVGMSSLRLAGSQHVDLVLETVALGAHLEDGLVVRAVGRREHHRHDHRNAAIDVAPETGVIHAQVRVRASLHNHEMQHRQVLIAVEDEREVRDLNRIVENEAREGVTSSVERAGIARSLALNAKRLQHTLVVSAGNMVELSRHGLRRTDIGDGQTMSRNQFLSNDTLDISVVLTGSDGVRDLSGLGTQRDRRSNRRSSSRSNSLGSPGRRCHDLMIN